MTKPTLEQWMQGAKDCEMVWDEYMDDAYARYMAQSEAYLFEDNYEPFENKALPTKPKREFLEAEEAFLFDPAKHSTEWVPPRSGDLAVSLRNHAQHHAIAAALRNRNNIK